MGLERYVQKRFKQQLNLARILRHVYMYQHRLVYGIETQITHFLHDAFKNESSNLTRRKTKYRITMSHIKRQSCVHVDWLSR